MEPSDEQPRMRILIALLLLTTVAVHGAPADDDKQQKAIAAVLREQAEAWNRGDLDGFMLAYLNTPEMTYTASGVIINGYAALQKRYSERYGSSPQTMGRLRFGDLSTTMLGPDYAVSVGRWYLSRTGQADIDGVFSLVWKRTEDGWKILHDHSSLRTDGVQSSAPGRALPLGRARPAPRS